MPAHLEGAGYAVAVEVAVRYGRERRSDRAVRRIEREGECVRHAVVGRAKVERFPRRMVPRAGRIDLTRSARHCGRCQRCAGRVGVRHIVRGRVRGRPLGDRRHTVHRLDQLRCVEAAKERGHGHRKERPCRRERHRELHRRHPARRAARPDAGCARGPAHSSGSSFMICPTCAWNWASGAIVIEYVAAIPSASRSPRATPVAFAVAPAPSDTYE